MDDWLFTARGYRVITFRPCSFESIASLGHQGRELFNASMLATKFKIGAKAAGEKDQLEFTRAQCSPMILRGHLLMYTVHGGSFRVFSLSIIPSVSRTHA
jgi:hypothetical protein